MVVKNLDFKNKEILKKVVSIHMDTFKGFFLTFMGRGFLYQMYESYVIHAQSNLLLAIDENGNAIGFLAYTYDLSGLYKFMLRKRFFKFVWYSFLAFLRKPKIFIKLISALLKPKESEKKEKYVQITSIGVTPQYKSKGIGTLLFSFMKEKVDFDAYEYISLETDAVNNDLANHFYVKNGFVLFKEYETKEGRKMNEYRFYGGERR